MNPYGEQPSYGRAQVSGGGSYEYDADPYGAYADEYAADSYGADPYPADPYRADSYRSDAHGSAPPDPYARPVARAAVGAAAVGSAAVGRGSVTAPESPAPRYDWSHGSSGRATVPVSPSPGGVRGRASVPPPGSGGPPGPPGPGDGRPPARKKKKRHWVRNSLLSALAVLVMLAGGSMVALSYYVDDVLPPEQVDLAESSRIFFADGEEMATLQDVNREIIDTTVPELENARVAVVAAEDRGFYDHQGVDFVGIVRAAWNNFTGGSRQGASTIDQQYTRAADELFEDTYWRKLEEAAKAYKLNQAEDKDTILGYYLNTIYFGRGAHGIQAAAQSYFGKDAADLTLEEAALLAGVIRYPDDGSGLSPYDPLNNPENQDLVVGRFQYVLGQMVEMGALTPAERDAMEVPEVIDHVTGQDWHEGPQGPIVQQVYRELEAMGINDLLTGGYRITTTIDPDLQEAALDAARRENGGRLWEGGEGLRTPSDHVGAGLVAIDPSNGRVLAYYGGDDGVGYDLAGPNINESTGERYGGRPPGSSFKIYTLVAALREQVSVETHWKTTEYDADWMDGTVRNAGRVAHDCAGEAPDYCSLRWSTEQSYNVPFAYFSEAVGGGQGPAKIVQAAMDAGITMMTDTQDGIPHDLLQINDATEVAPEHFFHPVAYGQYPVTVLDHASGVATLASGGVHHKPHFVEKVEQRNDAGEWEVVFGDQIAGDPRIEEPVTRVITDVLKAVPGVSNAVLADGRPAAAKTGTWEHDEGGNADAWMVGYTPQIATAVWVGDPSDNPKPITYTDGSNIGSSALPSHVWKQFMDQAHAVKEWPIEQFPEAPDIGDPQHQYANGVRPEPEEDECLIPILCPGDDDDDDDDDDRRRNRGGGEGGGDGSPPGREDD